MAQEAGESFFTRSSPEILEEPNLFSDPEFDSCLKILQKSVSYRSTEDNEFLVKKIISLDIFKKSVLDNLDAKTVLTKLTPQMYYEYFPANTVLSEYDSHTEKFSIILQGKAKEFVPKTLQEMEKEADNFSKDIRLKRKSINTPSSADLCAPASLTSLGRDDEYNSQIPTMNTLADNKEYNSISTTANSKDKFVKINNMVPSLKRLTSQKWKNEDLDENQCQKVLKKMKCVIDSLNLDGVLESDFADKQLDEHALNEFKKHEKSYFLGGILKLKFSRFLCPGDYHGLNILKGESIANRAVIAAEDCHCLTMSKEDYIRVIENEKELNKDKIEFFQKLFAEKFHSRSLAEFALLWENQNYQMNQVVFQQDEPSDTLHALVSGEVVISKTMDAALKKSQANEELPLRIKRRHDSSEHLLKLVTICGGNFFGEEDFFNGQQRQFTATVSSTRAKVFKMSMQNFKTAQKDYKDIISEIEGLVRAKKDWEKQRLNYLSQQREPVQQTTEQYYKKKHQVIQFDHSSSKNNSNVDAHPKKLIMFKKEKSVNVRFQYDKLFVPKPEKGYPGYYDVITEETQKSKSMTPHHKIITPAKGFNFQNLRSGDYDNSLEDSRSEFLPSMSHTDLKRSTELNRKREDKNHQQSMKRILDGHFSTSRKNIVKQHYETNYNTLTENSLKISTRFFNADDDFTGRTNINNKSSPNAALRLDSDSALKTLSSNAMVTGTRPASRGVSGSKQVISELLHLLPLSVRTSVHNPHSTLFNDPLRIKSLKSSLKPQTEGKKTPMSRGNVRIVKVDCVNDAVLKSETTVNNVQDKENGIIEAVRMGGSATKRTPGKIVLTRSRSSFIKNL